MPGFFGFLQGGEITAPSKWQFDPHRHQTHGDIIMSNSDNCLHFRLKCSNTATQRTRHNSTHDPIQTMFGIYYQEIHGPLFHQSDTTTLYLLWWQPMSLQQFRERPKQWHLQPEESWQEGLNSSDAGRAKPTSSIFTDSTTEPELHVHTPLTCSLRHHTWPTHHAHLWYWLQNCIPHCYYTLYTA